MLIILPAIFLAFQICVSLAHAYILLFFCGVIFVKDSEVFNNIGDRLAGRTPVYPEEQMKETSAVLIPLIRKDDGLYLLYEQRASSLSAQPAEICFPGGRMEKDETTAQAAVRETCEELIIGEDQIRILGKMNAVMGPAGAPVWPIIGELSGYTGTFSTDEVEDILLIPYQWFREHPAEIYNTVLHTVAGDDFPYDLIPGGRDYPWRTKNQPMYFYRLDGRTIWGLTAHITSSFMKISS